MSEAAPGSETERREEVRPGLTMVVRRTLKEDGRTLIYYDFERPAGTGERQPPAGEPPDG